ncbi:hypothetical protein ACFLXI_03880 [Chloroflexota bacterium]
MLEKPSKVFLRILLPLVLITLACSLFSPPGEEPDPEPKSNQAGEVLKPTEEPDHTPSATSTPSADLAPTEPPDTSEPEVDPQSSTQAVYAWIPEVAYKTQSAGIFANLEIDSHDDLHLVFFQDTHDKVWWMQGQNNKWTRQEQITSGSGRGFHVSMVLDSQDNPHFAYHSVDTPEQAPFLYYKFWNGGSWTGVYKNREYDVVNTDISLALGPNDEPHIIFLEDYGQNLVYTRFENSAFINQVVGRANPDLKDLSLVVDFKGNPHLVYQSEEQGLMYATLQDGNWVWEVVDPAKGAGSYADITIDNHGGLHIAYYHKGEGSLIYARPSDDGWETQMVDEGGDLGQYPSITVDSSGDIHISYYDAANENLKYAYGTGVNWLIQTIDDLGSVGQYTSIALDSKGLPTIAYYDSQNQDVKLARAMPLQP